MRRSVAAGLPALIITVVLTLGAVPGTALERVPGVFHVHSTLSTGDYALDELANLAERDGVGAILLTENYLLRLEYGLPPFRALTRVTYEERSVLGTVEQYLARVAEMRQRFPRLVVIPGVEVIPHYHWTGNPLGLDVELHDLQKNMLVFGLDARALRALPVVGNPGARELAPQSLVDFLPALLIAPGLMILARPRVRRVRLGSAIVVTRQRRWLAGGLVLGLGLLTFARAWPFTVDHYPPWSDFGVDPHQALIDDVERRGGLTVWSFPEAPDIGERYLGPVRVSWRTDPYPDDLFRVSGYIAFGGVYEQPIKLTLPGGGWDRLLKQYVAGERARPVWAVGESGFHNTSARKTLTGVETVFLVTERSEAGVLDALKRGHMYAVRRSGPVTLALSDFVVAASTGAAGSGDTLRAPPGSPLEVRVGIEAAGGGAHPVRVMLLKNGELAASWNGTTPLQAVHRDTADVRPMFYRLEARVSAGEYLIANPIFVAP